MTEAHPTFKLDAYLERIGLGTLSDRPTIAQVHRAHSVAIPFENLQPHGGAPVSLALDDLQRKLVQERRGGYCFEQNLLLKGALEALGTEVDLLLARTWFGAPPGTIRPRSHLVLRVTAEGAVWHADVGYGMGTLFEPLPFGAGAEHEQSGWLFRIAQHGSELMLQALLDGAWVDLYSFPPEPVPFVDVDTVNWWASTSPRSPFVSGLVVGAQRNDGKRLSLRGSTAELRLLEQTPTRANATAVAWEDVPELLASRFALTGVEFGRDGRLQIADLAR